MTVLISSRVSQCLQVFKAVLDSFRQDRDETYGPLAEEFARLKLWTGNIGAHRNGRSSLDYRLRDASHLRDLVLRLLGDLETTLHEVPSFTKGGIMPTIGLGTVRLQDVQNQGLLPLHDQLDEHSELVEITAEINDIICCLLRLSISIRNPAPHDRFMSSKFTDTCYFEDFDVAHVQAKFPGLDISLTKRLGNAISQRRQYFKYREHHHQMLSWGLDEPNMPHHDYQSTVASSIRNDLKTNAGGQPTFSRLNEDEKSDTGATTTSFGTSIADSGRLKVPPLPKQANEGPFECPYCFMIISVSTRAGWKKHVYADLRPYTCLAPSCLTPEKQYAHRHEWIDHMSQSHWTIFLCPYPCGEENFARPSHLIRHIQESHALLSSGSDLNTLAQLCKRPAPWAQDTQCPFCLQCLESVKVYARHVGWHQIELALFALPNIEAEDEEEPKDTEAHQEQEDDSLNGSEPELEFFDDNDIQMRQSSDDLEVRELGGSSLIKSYPTEDDLSIVTPGTPKEGPVPEPVANVEPLICPECGRQFDQIHKLNHHMIYHNRTHECGYAGCDKKFGTKTHLDRHINDRHLKLKAYHCTEADCPWYKGGKSFPRKDNWRRHMIKKHGTKPEDLEILPQSEL